MTRPAADGGHHDWSGFNRLLVGLAGLFFLLAFGFLLAVDPYDTGRLALLDRSGVHEQFPTTANASRGRDPGFNAAIFGNSRVQQLRPERLDGLTKLSFVSLTTPGSQPGDQLLLLRWFLRTKETAPRAVVIGMDAPWCRPEITASERFPTWLYADSIFAYAGGLIRYRSFEAAGARLAFLATGRNGARRDGYWDYIPVFQRMGLENAEASRRRLAEVSPSFVVNPAGRFPAIDALGEALKIAPAGTAFVLLRPPVYAGGLPKPETQDMRVLQACAAAVERLVAARPGTAVIDLLKPGPIAQEPANFYDYDHYRDPLAQEIERMIAARLGTT